MKVNELWDKFWALIDKNDGDKLLPWLNKLLNQQPNDIDIRHFFIDALLWNHLDVEVEQQEPVFTNLCTSIIRDKENQKPLTVAKAYTYRGEIKYYAIDRRKDFDKAKDILKGLNSRDTEVLFLKQFIKLYYPLNFRQYLPIDLDYRNMLKF